MWLRIVLFVTYVFYGVLSEEIFEGNDIDSEDYFMQDLPPRMKKSPIIFDTVDKKIGTAASDSESDIKYILARDIKKRIEALKELNDAFDTVKTSIDSKKREVQGGKYTGTALPKSENNSTQSETLPSQEPPTEDDLSRSTRQYYPTNDRYIIDKYNQGRQFPINNKFERGGSYSTIDPSGRGREYDYETGKQFYNMFPPSSSMYTGEDDPYIAQYNPSARTFGITGIRGGYEARETDAESGTKGGTVEGGVVKDGALDGGVIKQERTEGGLVKGGYGHSGQGVGGGLGGGLGGGSLGGGGTTHAVHPLRQIKYLLPNFISALTAAIGGASPGYGGVGVGGSGGGVGGIGGIGGLGGGLGGKHKHLLIAKPAVAVHKPTPIKPKPVAGSVIHNPVHSVTSEKETNKGKGGFFYSKNIIFGKVDDKPQHGPIFPEGHYSNYPSYYIYPHGGQAGYSGYSYLSPFNVQYAERSPYYIPEYLPDSQSIYGAGGSPEYSQGNSYLEPSYLPFGQGQYYYPIDVKSINDEGLAQFQFYSNPTALSNPNTDNYTSSNTVLYERTHSQKAEQNYSSRVEKLKADIEEEQRRIIELQDGLKSYAQNLNISPHEDKSNSFAKEVDELNTSWDSLKEDMKQLNDHSENNFKEKLNSERRVEIVKQ